MLFSNFAPAFIAGSLFVVLLCFGACNSKKDETPAQAQSRRGQSIYTLNCSACHNISNPAKDGSLAPAIQGSSLELLQAKILRGEYPLGYAPKRNSKIMQRLPLTEIDIQDLHRFLNP